VAWQHIHLCGRHEFTKAPESINMAAIIQALVSFVELSCGVFEGLNGVLFGTEYQRKEPYRHMI
jgi:hypothetical protein